MDLSQGIRQLQGMQRAGPVPSILELEGAAARANAVNQMESLLLLQHAKMQTDMLGRSSSALELPQASALQLQQANPQFPMGGSSAMLMGTVAALQEEGCQLRTQWKSDVTRLERELDQLRTAAAWALPQLAEAQKAPELGLSLSNGNSMASLQQALMMQGALQASTAPQTARTESSQFSEADRELLLNRIIELERQKKEMEMQRDQAMICASANSTPSARERQPMENTLTSIPERNPTHTFHDSHEQSAMQLTEALLAQMRADSTAAQELQEPPFASLSLGSAAPPVRSQDSREVNGYATATDSTRDDVVQVMSEEMKQIYQELERMQIELHKIREDNSKLKDEKEACEAAHSRDVSALEAMLDSMMAENKRLKEAIAGNVLSSTKKPASDSLDYKFADRIADSKKIETPLTPHSIRSVSEPGIEPDIERSIELDRSKLNVSMTLSSQYAGMAR